ncbi:hypothetical protein [Winogradskyella sp. A3E31]|uniref:hypothetical protein n=1 Tax=Winogradskyella sp. A3E31 TaxID=3349637 RepID=UPI00398ADC07
MDRNYTSIDRRTAIKTSALTALGLAIPNVIFSNSQNNTFNTGSLRTEVPKHFPNIDPEIVAEVVGRSHADIDRVKELVGGRPELARSVWEWRFGDFESAIGAASHVGRRDIALYLIEKGARPTLYTFAMLGAYETVKSMIEFSPGIQKNCGPHGISLLSHAYAGERMKDSMSLKEKDSLKRTIDYLESLGDANGETYIDVSPKDQEKYLGDYKYGSGDKEGFTVAVNMRKLLSLAPLGGFGGAIYKVAENKFIYNGAPSVTISFNIENDIVKSLTLSEPGLEVIATKQ